MSVYEFHADLRSCLKSSGFHGEITVRDGVITWQPRADLSAEQITAGQAIVAAWDTTAQASWKVTRDRAAVIAGLANGDVQAKALRAVLLIVLDELNAHALKLNAILDAVDGAANLAGLKTAVAAIADYPPRTKAQLLTAITNKVNAGGADS